MKVALICPSERPGVPFIGQSRPLAAVPLLGQSLLEYWLAHLAASRVKEVMILASDRPEVIKAIAGDGARWGLKISVIEESRELTPAQALIKYGRDLDPAFLQNGVAVLDHFPGGDAELLFESYASWFAVQLAFMASAKTPERVGIRQTGEMIWTGLHSHVSPEAVLQGPCWIGRNVIIGPGGVVGPNAIIEDGAFLEASAVIADSYIGADTFVGKFNNVAQSIALGSTLINWASGSATTVPDPFLLSSLRGERLAHSHGILSRVVDMYSRNKNEMHLLWKQFVLNKES
jgi:NDP-sugar pyrophosphorylase family protein